MVPGSPIYLVLVLGLFACTSVLAQKRNLTSAEEAEYKTFLKNEFERISSENCFNLVQAEWAVSTDWTDEHRKELENQIVINAAYQKKVYDDRFENINYEAISDPELQRQMKFLTELGRAKLSEQRLKDYAKVTGDMEATYNQGEICPFDEQNSCAENKKLTLDPEITKIMAESRNYDELLYVWKAWRDVSGKKIKADYMKYVEISNEAAKLNDFVDYGEMWRNTYEDENFIENIEMLWNQLSPLYNTLHKYVKLRLMEAYPQIEKDTDLIPAHLLGNMWAQSWTNVYDLVEPFPNATKIDVKSAMEEGNYTAKKMFEVSDEFYKGLGLEPNDMSYGPKAMIEKPVDRNVTCHASAWDFCQNNDFRIKMCTSVNMEDFVTVHHEMGHIQYYILYQHQPLVLRSGANPGFHEAVGDTIALSVSTPGHLKKIGLLADYTDNEANDINSLMRMALERVAFLPFGLLLDKWRWNVFNKSISEKEWNAEWWKLREKYQKVSAPVPRSDADFDPGAKYHVPGDSQYIAYFIAHVLEFQLHRSLCITAGQYDPKNPSIKPLHRCDIHNSKAAGTRLRDGLKLGASKPWPEALHAMTDETELSGSAMLEYFKPLQNYLENEINIMSSKNNPPEDVDQTIPIVVGSILLAVVVVALGVWIYIRHRNQSK